MKNSKCLHIVVWALLCVLSSAAQALDIRAVRFGVHEARSRIVVEMDGPAAYRAAILADPWRLAVDLPSFAWQAPATRTPPGALISGIRQGVLQAGTSRIVFTLTKPAVIQSVFTIPAGDGAPDRLVIDFTGSEASAATARLSQSFGALGNGAAIPADKPALRAAAAAPVEDKSPPTRKPLIILDPGHGGIDPGTIGAGGVHEKDITLVIAQVLKKELEKTGRYDVLLTRSRDVYLFLKDRVAFARDHKGDLFISLHADSSPGGPGVGGASVYSLSETASDAMTESLAARENRADQVAGMDLRHQDDDVANILVDLAMRNAVNQSSFFANTIAGNMQTNGIHTLERPHRAAGFAVLKDADMPSILVEMGFLSNPREAQALADPAFQKKLARTLVTSVDTYFSRVAIAAPE